MCYKINASRENLRKKNIYNEKGGTVKKVKLVTKI